MKLKPLLSTIILLSLSSVNLADAFDEMETETYEKKRADEAHINADMEFGGCLPELRAQNERATKMLAVLSKKKSKIAKLEAKVDTLTAKLITRSDMQACDTSSLSQQVANLQVANAQLKSENGRLISDLLAASNNTNMSGNAQATLLRAQNENQDLRLKIAKLQSELTLGSRLNTTIATTNTSSSDAEMIEADWSWSAKDFKNRLGQDFAYICPPKGEIHRIYGTDKYTVDSSVCSAAAHMGLITPLSGGTVVIRIAGNKVGFKSSNKHGIQSRQYNRQHLSFIFLK